jgi:hypothetical protein
MAIQRVYDFKEMEITYQSNGVSTVQFYTDMPGGVLAPRLGAGITMASTGGTRKTLPIPLDAIQGTIFYPVFTPGPTTQLFLLAGKIWMRAIGLYLDGSLVPGEIWSPQPIAPGS